MGGESTTASYDKPTGTIISTVATITNNIIGAGLLALPYTFKRASLLPGVISMVITGLLNAFTMVLLAKNCELSGGKSYKELGELAFGPRVSTFMASMMSAYTLGSCVSYVVLLGDALPELIGSSSSSASNSSILNFWENRAALLPICGAVVLLPLAVNRNLSSLRYTAIVSFVCIVYTAGMIVTRAATSPVSSSIEYARSGPGVLVGIPITLTGFTMHYNTPRFWHELQEATFRKFSLIAAICFGFSLVVYEATAGSGYALFGADVKGDILENFADNDVPALIARIALVLVMFFSYPLAFNSFRASVTSLLPKTWQARIAAGPIRCANMLKLGGRNDIDYNNAVNEADGDKTVMIEKNGENGPLHVSSSASPPPRATTFAVWIRAQLEDWPHAIVTTLLIAATVLVAIALPQLEVILGYKGALGGTLIVYVFPASMYFIFSARKARGMRVGKEEYSTSPSSIHHQSPHKPPQKSGGNNNNTNMTPTASSSWRNNGFFSFFSTGRKSRRGGDTGGGDGGPDDDDDSRSMTSDFERSHTPLLWGNSTTSMTKSNRSNGNMYVTTPSSVGNGAGASPSQFAPSSPPILVGGSGNTPSLAQDEDENVGGASVGGGGGVMVEEEGVGEGFPGDWKAVFQELTTTQHGAVVLFFGAWGFSVMILGTITTAGLIG